MDVRSCKMCGKLYNFMGNSTPICPSCQKLMDDRFSIVKQFIYDNPGASLQKVSEDTEVPIKQIKIWVKEEKLSFSEGSLIGVECEKCGAIIRTGRFCSACKGKINDTLSSVIPKPEIQQRKPDKREQAKMRFLEN